MTLYGRLLAIGSLCLLLSSGCGCEPSSASDTSRFAKMETADLTITDHTIHAWLAKSGEQIRAGLMYATDQDLKPLPDGRERGMLFIFDRQRSARNGFWMKNVPIPLDIAFIDSSGTIVTIRTMAPFDTRSTYPTGPYQYALEVKGGLFKSLGIEAGDKVEIPDEALNSAE